MLSETPVETGRTFYIYRALSESSKSSSKISEGEVRDSPRFSGKRKGTWVPILSPYGEDLVIVVRYSNNLFAGEEGMAGLRPLTASRFALRRLTLLVEPVNQMNLGFESILIEPLHSVARGFSCLAEKEGFEPSIRC